jgi:hypothetical protein
MIVALAIGDERKVLTDTTLDIQIPLESSLCALRMCMQHKPMHFVYKATYIAPTKA